ncbi:MAG: hypothetical protein BMS9Abin23_0993 [Thermodesulfobacteriota bacterium]|nr:MAG: hypothetical protein BMS9Abin23_0993 [Thermodesulfobacteriota bacterium]
MRKPPRISVITPSFNQGKFIERTIKSVIGQGYPDLEYIVVDGGSTDETISILKKYEKNLRWISEKDRGQSDAINKGIRMSTGDIIAYLNSDDMYEPGTLGHVAGFFTAHPSVMWLSGRCRIVDEREREFRRFITRYKNFLLARYSYSILLVTNFICQPATFLRRDVIEDFGVFDVNQHRVMDYDYWLRIGKTHTPGIINENLAMFRVYSESKTSSGFTDTFREEFEVCKKHSRSTVLRSLHYLSCKGICGAYWVLDLISNFGHKR